MFTLRSIVSWSATLVVPTLAGVVDEPTLEQRLAQLTETLESARQDAHVPGMSIAIVQGDEIVYAQGFGYADLENERPADAETIYAVGSTTKAFTATLVGMLVDDGRLSWDDPVAQYLPYFDLDVRSTDPDAACTLRDLLSHRHGFSRMGLLWIGNALSREEILRTAAGAEPFDDFRAGFHYCNVTYLAAGEAAGAAVGSSWDDLMRERILDPLGMKASTLSTVAAQKDARLALGYSWDEVDEVFEHEEMLELAQVGPAGSLNANVLDMAQWVRLQLAGGVYEGQRLVSEESLDATHTSQITIGPGADYGLGWMLREHGGRRLVEHGGNINGFSAEVGLMPEEDLGFVLLMNLDVSPMQQSCLALVFDALLEPWADEAVAAAAGEVDFEDFVGTYVANFASFRDEEFRVLVEDDALALDVPSQQTFELKLPDEEGKWYFTLTDQVAVSFERDAQGAVTGLRMHQNGFSFDVPRKGYEGPETDDADRFEGYLGTYERERGGKLVELVVERGRLTMIDRGNHLAFEEADSEGFAALRARADYGATFQTDAEGQVESFVFRGSAGERLFKRVEGPAAKDLPTVEELLELRSTAERVAVAEAAKGTRIVGEIWVPQAGVRGTLLMFYAGTERYANHLDFGKLGRVDTVVRDGEAWSRNPMRGFDELKGEPLRHAVLAHPAAVEGDWREFFDSIEVVREEELDGRRVFVLRLSQGDSPSRSYRVDAETGDVVRVDTMAIEGKVRVPVAIRYSDFREDGGRRSPWRAEIENPASGKMIMTFDTVESGLELPDETFHLAASED